MSAGVQSPTYEMASVLFMDIVGYSLGSIDEQTELLTMLQTIVRDTTEYQSAFAKDELLSLPSGDGMALVFLRDPVSPAKCALEIAAALKDHAQIKLRMGLHIGPVRRHADIRENMNVVGGGINMAQRVMDCGDTGHILVSQQVAEVLQQLRGWSDLLHDLGVQEVKHGVKVHLYSLSKDGLGNQHIPKKLQPAAAAGIPQPRPRSQWAYVTALVLVVLAGVFFALRDSKKPVVPPARPAEASLPERELRYSNVNSLFPSPAAFDGSARLDAGKEFKTGYLVFDKEKGREKLWLVWSDAPIPELDALKQWVNSKDIGAVKNINQARAALDLVAKHAANVAVSEANEMTVLKGRASVLAYRITLDHD